MTQKTHTSTSVPFEWPFGTSKRDRAVMEDMAKNAVPNGTPFDRSRWLQRNSWRVLSRRELKPGRFARAVSG